MKTLELENYGVQEMSINEMKEIDGGIIPFILAGIILWGSIAPYYANWDDI